MIIKSPLYNIYYNLLPRNVLINVSTSVAIENYKERIFYDANGNIQTYLRNNETGAAKINYNYAYTSGTNKLAGITNSVNSQTKSYAYDAIGNTTEDGMQGITNAVWNGYGKLQSLVNKNEQSIVYNYSSDGQRINKKVGSTEEWYVRDASGNIMATHKKDASINYGNLTVTEIYKYGSSLLIIKDARINVQNPTGGGSNNFVRGNDNYILTDANGNTKATVSDKKIQHSTDGVTVDYYTAEVRTATLHSTYGANAKIFNGGFLSANFNGQRKITEIGEDAQTALFWEYNGDVGRRWNRDQIVKEWESPYAAFGGNPIVMVDPLGLDWYKDTKGSDKGQVRWYDGSGKRKGMSHIGASYDGYSMEASGKRWMNGGADGQKILWDDPVIITATKKTSLADKAGALNWANFDKVAAKKWERGLWNYHDKREFGASPTEAGQSYGNLGSTYERYYQAEKDWKAMSLGAIGNIGAPLVIVGALEIGAGTLIVNSYSQISILSANLSMEASVGVHLLKNQIVKLAVNEAAL